mmetsp:Transcript_36382/g.145389  ORF Transcript_36382/g.145389 Transcript_36382/m.145389 type:complete len:182 (-) Transcript_36382:668-1213(-)|eukprot:CAMPEP_0113964416 /NCGR_PEP_ID=MMETSP0011_2-20120614/7126_1 /TAXON_ID=101924 /ORGANISM="Rhodosorus marinus" /LENGTH=181 /DNA_ID=CAMNT_0000976713 /DNA_START=210 /DNA_END=755 /DNA_ORIENTATION=- /assembly_acc=CAM_ASM_000156
MGTQPLVTSMVILNTEGMRVCARYCNKSLFPDLESERAFERDLLKKVSATVTSHDEEIFELDNHLVVYKWYDNVVMFLTGSTSENELVLADILRTYEEGLSIILRTMLEEKTLLDNLETVLLAMDELIDQEGIILETDPQLLAARVSSGGASLADGMPLGEQTFTQAFQSARDQLTRSILS